MKDKDLELIYKFLDNELTEDEVKLFKEKYASDPEFKKEVNLISKIYISLDAASRDSKKADPVTTKNTFSKHKEKESRKNLLILYRYAAIILPLIAFGIIMLNIQEGPRPDPKELFGNYFKGLSTKGISEDDTMDFSRLLNNIDSLTRENLSTLDSEGRLFNFAVYCMQQNRFPEAVDVFKGLLGYTRAYREDSQWYLALCYLRTGENDKAIEMLEQISGLDSHLYQGVSKELLKQLK